MNSKMYRIVLASLLALALMETATACPPAQTRITIVDGKEVVEWFCPPENVMYFVDNFYRCFPTCPSCPNGFCHDGQCDCFPNTIPEKAGVCGKICANCTNGWCSSQTKCECYDGFAMVSGQCVPALAQPDPLPKPTTNSPPRPCPDCSTNLVDPSALTAVIPKRSRRSPKTRARNFIRN